MPLDFVGISEDVEQFNQKIVKQGKNNDYCLEIEGNHINSILINFIELTQLYAGATKTLYHPNIILILSNSSFRKSQMCKELEDNVIKTLKPNKTNCGCFGKIGKSTVNLYGPIQHRFSVEPNAQHENDHNSLKRKIHELIDKYSGSMTFVKFPDFQTMIRVILSSKYCAKCLEIIAARLVEDKSKCMNFIDFVVKGLRNELRWVDEEGKEYPVNSYRTNSEGFLVQKSRDYTELVELGRGEGTSATIIKNIPSFLPVEKKIIVKKGEKEKEESELSEKFGEMLEKFREKVARRRKRLWAEDKFDEMNNVAKEMKEIDNFLKSDYTDLPTSLSMSDDDDDYDDEQEEEEEYEDEEELEEEHVEEEEDERKELEEEKEEQVKEVEAVEEVENEKKIIENNEKVAENRKRIHSSSSECEVIYAKVTPKSAPPNNNVVQETVQLDDSFGFVDFDSSPEKEKEKTEEVGSFFSLLDMTKIFQKST